MRQRPSLALRPGTLRLSVGLEHPDDLIADLGRALGHRCLAARDAALAAILHHRPFEPAHRGVHRPASQAGVELAVDVRTHPEIAVQSAIQQRRRSEPAPSAPPGSATGTSRRSAACAARKERRGPSPNGFWDNETFPQFRRLHRDGGVPAGLGELARWAGRKFARSSARRRTGGSATGRSSRITCSRQAKREPHHGRGPA